MLSDPGYGLDVFGPPIKLAYCLFRLPSRSFATYVFPCSGSSPFPR